MSRFRRFIVGLVLSAFVSTNLLLPSSASAAGSMVFGGFKNYYDLEKANPKEGYPLLISESREQEEGMPTRRLAWSQRNFREAAGSCCTRSFKQCIRVFLAAGCVASLSAPFTTTWALCASSHGRLENAEAISANLRDLCRTDPNWKAACAELDPQACLNQDHLYLQKIFPGYQRGNEESIQWLIGDCGEWDGFTHYLDHVSKHRNGPPSRERIFTNDLSPLIQKCPNFPEYQKFLNSTEMEACKKYMSDRCSEGGYFGYTVLGIAIAFVGSNTFGALLMGEVND